MKILFAISIIFSSSAAFSGIAPVFECEFVSTKSCSNGTNARYFECNGGKKGWLAYKYKDATQNLKECGGSCVRIDAADVSCSTGTDNKAKAKFSAGISEYALTESFDETLNCPPAIPPKVKGRVYR